MKPNTTAMLTVFAALVAASACMGTQTQTQTPKMSDDNSMTEKDDAMMKDDTMVEEGGMKVFSLTGVNFKFIMDGVDNPSLNVNKGDRVRIDFQSTQGFHDL